MPTVHEKGYLSEKRDYFYYNAESEQWFRLLIRGGYEQGYLKEIAIALTPPYGFIKVSDVLNISREFIHIYDPVVVNKNDTYTHVLPRQVYTTLIENIGEGLTNRLIDFNYVAIVDLKKLLECESKGGDYLGNILDPMPKYDRVKARIESVEGYYKKPIKEYPDD